MFTLLAKIVLLSVGSPRQTVLIPFLSFVQHCQTINSNIVKYPIHVCWKVIIGEITDRSAGVTTVSAGLWCIKRSLY